MKAVNILWYGSVVGILQWRYRPRAQKGWVNELKLGKFSTSTSFVRLSWSSAIMLLSTVGVGNALVESVKRGDRRALQSLLEKYPAALSSSINHRQVNCPLAKVLKFSFSSSPKLNGRWAGLLFPCQSTLGSTRWWSWRCNSVRICIWNKVYVFILLSLSI